MLTAMQAQYHELRAMTDCLLGFQVGEALEFHGLDALRVAEACGLPLTSRWVDRKGDPIPLCVLPITVFTQPVDATAEKRVLRFEGTSADWLDAILAAGLPLAVAMEKTGEDGEPWWEIPFEFRPRHDRPPLRVVE